MRKRRDQVVIARTLEAKPWCQKCGVRHELTVHHIVAVADGGADSADNTDTLCDRCHREWHRYEHCIPYSDWLSLPPLSLLLKMTQMDLPGPEGAALEAAFLTIRETYAKYMDVCRMSGGNAFDPW